MAVGDVNNDGLDDIFIGGSGANPTTLLLQQKDGTFINKNILPGQDKKNWMIWDWFCLMPIMMATWISI
ncbi:MAG: VCBS repeat-containing protein [Puia sp.]